MTTRRVPKLPKSVTVLGETFTVEQGGAEPSDPETFGETLVSERIIRVFDYAATKKMVVRTWAHEIWHAALGVSGWSDMLTKAGLDEEGLVVMLEATTMQQLPILMRLTKLHKDDK